jgi:BolA protein
VNERLQRIQARLEQEFAPQLLRLTDDSQQHVGHKGAGGLGHYSVYICATAFSGRSPLQRHRLIYAALAELMQTDIHALHIQAISPEELAAPTPSAGSD